VPEIKHFVGVSDMYVLSESLTLSRMADHYRKTIDLLVEVDELETKLDQAYAERAHPAITGDLQGQIGRRLKRAQIHSNLAMAQAQYDRPVSS
jgi:hypothetical protein